MHRKDLTGESRIKSGSVSSTSPHFVTELKSVQFQIGQPVCLECCITGNPTPQIQWEKFSRPLLSSRNIIIQRQGERCTLRIPCCKKQDVGQYTCIASNNFGIVRTTAMINLEERHLNTTKDKDISASSSFEAKNSAMSNGVLTDNETFNVKKRRRPPHFLLPPRNKIVNEGDNVRFLCSYTGYPEPRISWKINDRDLLFEDRISLTQTESLYILQINSVLPEDGGDYAVLLENELGVAVESAHLEVKAKNNRSMSAPPKVLRTLADCVATDEEPWTLTCEVIGNPTPSVRWYKDNKIISQCQDFKMLYDGHTASLILSEIYPDDEGQYTCVATNEFGKVETSCHLDVREAGTPPSFLGTLDDIEALDGDTVTFTVQVTGTQPIEIIWVHNDQEVKHCRDFKYITHEDGITHSLVIDDVFIEDAGLYVCEAYNNYGDAEILCKLSVRERFPDKHDNEVFEGQSNVSKEACAEEKHITPETKVNHEENISNEMVDGKTEQSENKQRPPIYRTESSKLRQRPPIEKVEEDLETECLPPKECLKFIPAQILKGPHSLAVLRNEPITLKVDFVGTPNPSITWIKSGKIICSNDHIKICNENESSCLFIQNSNADDSGKYVVTVENSAGSDCGFASVAVEGPPDPPAGQPNISDVTSHSVILSWYGAVFDGGSIITGYVVEMRVLPDESWEKIGICHSTCLVVNRLSPGKKYQFRVKTENIHGLSKPSKESDTVLIMEGTGEEEGDFEVFDHRIVHVEKGSHFSESYELKEEVGRGRFGTVFRCVEMRTKEVRAAKIVKCLKKKDKSKVIEEIEIMNRLRHPKLLQLAAAFENPRDMVLVMEYISGGELFERIIADDFVLTEDDCILFMHQICDGVKYMHHNNVIHLDLKPENILCKTKMSHQIKIIDFGLARVYDPTDNLRILFGTPEFVAPEVIGYEPVSPASDMWSIGVICYVLLSGLSPFMGDNDAETFTNITKSYFDFEDEAFDAISAEAKDFINSLLIKRPEKRMTAEQCLEHQWLVEKQCKEKGVQLSTDKLKKFIIRRKWQKSGNAIRALGRMVSLSGLSGSRSSLSSFSSLNSFSERSDSETSSPTLSSMNRFSNREPIEEYMESINKKTEKS